jgi:uncharacterized protein
VLYRRLEFLGLTANPDQSEKPAGFILSHNPKSKEEVDEILVSALKVGRTQIGQIQDEPWGYSASLADPDGHQLEIVYMPTYDNN